MRYHPIVRGIPNSTCLSLNFHSAPLLSLSREQLHVDKRKFACHRIARSPTAFVPRRETHSYAHQADRRQRGNHCRCISDA
jgi:hypothetical protein